MCQCVIASALSNNNTGLHDATNYKAAPSYFSLVSINYFCFLAKKRNTPYFVVLFCSYIHTYIHIHFFPFVSVCLVSRFYEPHYDNVKTESSGPVTILMKTEK